MTTSGAPPDTPASPPRKVLIVVRGFVPYEPSLGGVIRVIKLATYLMRQGYQVFIVAAKGQYVSDFGYADEISSAKITYFTDKTQERYSRKYIGPAADATDEMAPWYRRWVERLFQIAKTALVPDPGVLYVWPQYTAAKRLVESESITNVIVSSPAHSSQLAGWLLKRRFGDRINLIADYRDSWNCTDLFAAKGPVSGFVSRKMEASVLRIVDHFLYVSEPMLSKIKATFFDISQKATLVMNGYDLSMRTPTVPCDVSEHGPLTLGYFGRASDAPASFYNPTGLFHALARFGANLRLEMYGPVQVSTASQAGLEEVIRVLGSVDHAEALRQMGRMDVLVMIYTVDQGSDEIVSGKLFEYMLAGRPILIVGPEDMEARRIVLEKGIGYWADFRYVAAIEATLAKIYDDWKNGILPSYALEQVSEFNRERQFAKVLPLLRQPGPHPPAKADRRLPPTSVR